MRFLRPNLGAGELEALRELEGIPYPSEKALEEDRQYFIKKMKWNESQLKGYLDRQEKLHSEYGTEQPLMESLLKVNKIVKGLCTKA